MALKVKLTRIGSKNDPKYRIVIAEARSKRDGKYVANIGFYDPVPEKHILKVDEEKLSYWLSQGATFTKGTQRLLSKYSK